MKLMKIICGERHETDWTTVEKSMAQTLDSESVWPREQLKRKRRMGKMLWSTG